MKAIKDLTMNDVKKVYIENLNKLKVREAACLLIERNYKAMVREHEWLVEEIAYLKQELEEAKEDLAEKDDHIVWWERNSIADEGD